MVKDVEVMKFSFFLYSCCSCQFILGKFKATYNVSVCARLHFGNGFFLLTQWSRYKPRLFSHLRRTFSWLLFGGISLSTHRSWFMGISNKWCGLVLYSFSFYPSVSQSLFLSFTFRRHGPDMGRNNQRMESPSSQVLLFFSIAALPVSFFLGRLR